MAEVEQPPNSALNVKLDYIQRDVTEIKGDIKDVKKDYISRREFTDALTALRDEIAPLRKFVYAIISVFGVAVIGAILSLVLKR